jgi:aspartate racemase
MLAPDDALQQTAIQPAIYDPTYGLKACGQATERARSDLMLGVEALRQAGAEAIILGCTELPLALPERELEGLLLIDPTLVLARALIREVMPEKLRVCP